MFAHISYIEKPKIYQLKLKAKGKEFQPVFSKLETAIEARNAIYKGGYFSNLVHLKERDPELKLKLVEHISHGYTSYVVRINMYDLQTRKHYQKYMHLSDGLSSEKKLLERAYKVQRNHVKQYNKIVRLYNTIRTHDLLRLAQIELETLEPRVKSMYEFDSELWEICYNLAGRDISKIKFGKY